MYCNESNKIPNPVNSCVPISGFGHTLGLSSLESPLVITALTGAGAGGGAIAVESGTSSGQNTIIKQN